MCFGICQVKSDLDALKAGVHSCLQAFAAKTIASQPIDLFAKAKDVACVIRLSCPDIGLRRLQSPHHLIKQFVRYFPHVANI